MIGQTKQLYKDAFQGLSKEVWLLAVVLLINRSGAMVVPFLSVYLTTGLNFSLAQAGWVMTAFGFGSVVGAFAGGKLTDRIGFLNVQFLSLLCTGLAFLNLLWVHSFEGICLVIFITTAFADAFRPAAFTAVAAYSSPENRTRAIALIRLAINLGMAVGPAVGGFIAVLYGFHYLFVIDAVTCLMAAFFLRYAFQNQKSVEPSPTSAKEPTAESVAFVSPYRDSRYLFFIVLVFLNAVAFFQILGTLPVFFRQVYQLNESQIGWLLTVNGLLIALTEMPLIYLLEKRLSKIQIVIIGTLLIGLSYWLFNWFPISSITGLVAVIVLTIGEMTSLPFLSTLAINRANDQNRGQYMAVFTMAYSISHIVASNLGLQIADQFSFTVLWHVIAGISLMACLGFVLLEYTTGRY